MADKVVIGFLGTTLDTGMGSERWEKWRPSISLCRHQDLLIHRFELLHDERHGDLAKQVSADINQISPETNVRPQQLHLKDPWEFEEVYGALHDFCSGYPFDTDNEEYLVHITTGTHVAQICLFLLTEARYFPGRLIQASPSKRYWRTNPGQYRIIDLDLSKYDRITTRFQAERRDATSFLKSGIATRNDAFNRMIDRIEQVAIRSKAPVLLMGPTGAGKSQLARRIYELKKVRHQVEGPFVEVNCATLRGDSAMSALFGYKKGAFTGATSDRAGLLRAANGGLLLLDEIGELGLDEQAMILRAIEEGTFYPLGADDEVSSDFQLIAGTNRDLLQHVEAGRFREDLLARLNLWTFHLPGLKDRREDIEPNIDYELRRFAQHDGRQVTFNKEARDRFLRFATAEEAPWTANFRDLAASITRMATFAPNGRITEREVAEEIERLQRSWRRESRVEGQRLLVELLGKERLAQIDLFDQVQLEEVVQTCRTSKSLSAAGRKLFAASRAARKSTNDADRLRKYLARFDLDWQSLMP